MVNFLYLIIEPQSVPFHIQYVENGAYFELFPSIETLQFKIDLKYKISFFQIQIKICFLSKHKHSEMKRVCYIVKKYVAI